MALFFQHLMYLACAKNFGKMPESFPCITTNNYSERVCSQTRYAFPSLRFRSSFLAYFIILHLPVDTNTTPALGALGLPNSHQCECDLALRLTAPL
jgi:hypothetical protein